MADDGLLRRAKPSFNDEVVSYEDKPQADVD